MQAVLGALPPEARKTISFDTGAEFAPHRNLTAALATEAFFRDPHSPWQRGTIETTNGIFRRHRYRQPFGAASRRFQPLFSVDSCSVRPWEPTRK